MYIKDLTKNGLCKPRFSNLLQKWFTHTTYNQDYCKGPEAPQQKELYSAQPSLCIAERLLP